jgi:MoaA/NifB/PqqE/SkfB family radical SAM enzyme
MKNFEHWGIKKRIFPEHNYYAVWNNLKTIRLGEGHATELPPEYSEFYDVGINTCCNACCDFCYVSANKNGINYPDICETWEKWMKMYKTEKVNGVTITDKIFQCAIGSTGEATIHPQFCEFLETVYNTNVVPNYTTNGITLAKGDEYTEKLLDYTRRFVGGVAVSMGNKSLQKQAKKAIQILLDKGDTNVNIHHIISDKKSVDDFLKVQKKYGSDILYHVLLPLMPAGRSTKGVEDGAFEYLEDIIEKYDIKNVAFGAHFIETLKTSKIPTWLYEAESFSKNIILTKDKVQITPSSFDLKPIKIIEL